MNSLVMPAATLPIITNNYIGKDDHGNPIFDFERIIPIGEVPDWYEQRREKWGTKWIGYDVSIGDDRIDFYTAWTPPIPILKKLAELHKDYVFRLEYCEPGMAFQGKAVAKWQNGEVLVDDTCWDITGESTKETEYPPHINYEKLFDMWADFDDAEAPDEVIRLIDESGMGPVDGVSFAAFCYGYEQAMRKLKEGL
jgi:hypothetical protein